MTTLPLPSPDFASQSLRPFEAQSWAQQQKTGNPSRKAILMMLAEMSDERGSCYPGQDTIAEITEQSVRAVRDHLKWLEDHGLLHREVRFGDRGRGRTSDRYVLHVQPAKSAGKKSDQPADCADQPADQRTTNRQHVAGELPVELPEGTTRSLARPSFKDFWDAYPRHRDKGAARRAWETATKKASPDVIVAGAQRYAAERQGKDPAFTKHPTTWLRAEAWDDEPERPPAGAAPLIDPADWYK